MNVEKKNPFILTPSIWWIDVTEDFSMTARGHKLQVYEDRYTENYTL